MNFKKNIFLASLFFLPSLASAQITNPLKYTSFSSLLLGIAAGVGGIVASLGTIMIIVSGIMYLLSAGSPEKMNRANTALIYAIIGIAVGLAAYSIVQVIKNVIGA